MLRYLLNLVIEGAAITPYLLRTFYRVLLLLDAACLRTVCVCVYRMSSLFAFLCVYICSVVVTCFRLTGNCVPRASTVGNCVFRSQ